MNPSTQLFGQPITLVVVLALISLLPFAFMSATAFVKISTVLQIARSAIGAQSIPSSTVVMTLAAALTLLAMAPVGEQILTRVAPLLHDKQEDVATTAQHIFTAVGEPLRGFMKANASSKERDRFFQVAKKAQAKADSISLDADDFPVLIPAFVVTELGEAFTVGFLIFLPFLVIDLIVSNILLALGMQMLNPTQISLPFKLLLFVGIDGWGLLSQALVNGYR